ncbi:hypothetical protein DXG03_005795, partial [Asterophora parasitica]
IRLRLTPEPNPNLFSTGTDLLRGSVPWSINLAQIAKVKNYAPFKALVTADGLIDRRLMDSLEHAWEGYASGCLETQTLHMLSQPFETQLEDLDTRIGILTTRGHRHIMAFGLFRDQRTSSPSQFPYRGAPYPAAHASVSTHTHAGRILVHFEISPLPEHARPASRPPILVLRVLKFLTPIECSPAYDMHLPMPVEGGLLSKKRGKTVSSPMIFDLEKIKPDSTTLGGLHLLVE